MAEPYLRQSALAHLHLSARAVADPGDAGVRLGERPFPAMVNLRGDAEADAFAAAVEGCLGLALPRETGGAAGGDGLTALWLGPDEWLVVAAPERAGDPAGELRAALVGTHAAVTEVGESMTVIALAGRHAREVLAKGCALDLHPRAFGPGRCARTLLAKAQVILHQTDAAPAYDIYVERSVAGYLWLWLEDAAAEYGGAVIAG